MTRFVVPRMIESAGGGAIVNISSRAGSMVQAGFTSYGTAKAALSFMTRLMAPELAPEVRVNAIEVGGVETSALEMVLTDASVRRQLEENTPMRRIGHVDDVAAAVVYLASPAAAWVTGKVLEVDGGVEHPAFVVPFPPQ
jgi:7-alpha-hydroxysteroid dehydrogenase